MTIDKTPRVIAHRGWSTIFPENSMPAYGAALSAGADEIEFDVRVSKDNVAFACHDASTGRISDVDLTVRDTGARELSNMAIKIPNGPLAAGLGLTPVATILEFFYGKTGMNIHLKTTDALPEVLELLDGYLRSDGNGKGVYIAGSPDILIEAVKTHPLIPRCMLDSTNNADEAIDAALELECERVQLRSKSLTTQGVQRAVRHGIIPNLFYADDADSALSAIRSGIIGVLTNDVGPIAQVVKSASRGTAV